MNITTLTQKEMKSMPLSEKMLKDNQLPKRTLPSYLYITPEGLLIGECSILRKFSLVSCDMADKGRDCNSCWCG